MEQVLINLLTDAARYGEGKPVDVSLISDGFNAEIRVKDSRIGIAPEDQDRVFRPFESVVPPACPEFRYSDDESKRLLTVLNDLKR